MGNSLSPIPCPAIFIKIISHGIQKKLTAISSLIIHGFIFLSNLFYG